MRKPNRIKMTVKCMLCLLLFVLFSTHLSSAEVLIRNKWIQQYTKQELEIYSEIIVGLSQGSFHNHTFNFLYKFHIFPNEIIQCMKGIQHQYTAQTYYDIQKSRHAKTRQFHSHIFFIFIPRFDYNDYYRIRGNSHRGIDVERLISDTVLSFNAKSTIHGFHEIENFNKLFKGNLVTLKTNNTNDTANIRVEQTNFKDFMYCTPSTRIRFESTDSIKKSAVFTESNLELGGDIPYYDREEFPYLHKETMNYICKGLYCKHTVKIKNQHACDTILFHTSPYDINRAIFPALWETQMLFFGVEPPATFYWYQILQVFPGLMWCYVLLSLPFLYLSSRCFNFFHKNHLFNPHVLTYKLFLENASAVKGPKYFIGKVCFMMLWYYGLLICNAYKSFLLSKLTTPTPGFFPKTVNEIDSDRYNVVTDYNNDYLRFIHQWEQDQIQYIKNKRKEYPLNFLLKKFGSGEPYRSNSSMASLPGYLCLITVENIEIEKWLLKHNGIQIRRSDILFTEQMLMGVSNVIPLKEPVIRILNYLVASGLPDVWKSDEWYFAYIFEDPEREPVPITMEMIRCPFYAIIIGVLLSFVVFVSEKFCEKKE